jgi:hypothetical protein
MTRPRRGHRKRRADTDCERERKEDGIAKPASSSNAAARCSVEVLP